MKTAYLFIRESELWMNLFLLPLAFMFAWQVMKNIK